MEGEWTTRKSANWKTGKLNCKNTYKTILSRVRARTHHRSFYFFAVTSVTRKLYFTGFQLIADTTWININNEVIRVGLVRGKRYRKSHFTSCVSLNFRLFFVHLFLGVWHLWQQKNNIAVGRRAHVRVHTRRLNVPFCKTSVSISTHLQNNMSVFRCFFPLWGNTSPYTYRGGIGTAKKLPPAE